MNISKLEITPGMLLSCNHGVFLYQPFDVDATQREKHYIPPKTLLITFEPANITAIKPTILVFSEYGLGRVVVSSYQSEYNDRKFTLL